MSNATTLQTNNNKLSANNTDLASILETINGLPSAGGGSGVSLVGIAYTGEETQLMLNHGALSLSSDVTYKVTATNSSGETIAEETLSFQYFGSPDGAYDLYSGGNADTIGIQVIGNLPDDGATTGIGMFTDIFLITVNSTEATSVVICKL